MSKTIVKSVSLNLKDNTLTINACQSNESPREYESFTQSFKDKESLKARLVAFFQGVNDGDVVFTPSCTSKLFFIYQLYFFKLYEKGVNVVDNTDWLPELVDSIINDFNLNFKDQNEYLVTGLSQDNQGVVAGRPKLATRFNFIEVKKSANKYYGDDLLTKKQVLSSYFRMNKLLALISANVLIKSGYTGVKVIHV